MTDSETQYNKLLLSKERLNMVLEGGQHGFWDWNIKTGEVKRNDRWAQMLGYSSIKDFDENTDTWTNSIYPDDRDAAWTSINNHLEGRTDRHELEYRMLTKDGGYKWILDHAKIVQRDDNGNPLRMCGTHSDISERKQVEQALLVSERRLLDAQRVGKIGSFTFDLTTGFWSGSDMLYPILGIEEKREYSVEEWLEIIHPDSRDSLEAYQKSILEQKIPFDKEYLIVRQTDGKTRWVHSLGELQFDDSGKVISMHGTTQDITESKQAEEKLQDAKKNLETRVEERTLELSLAKKDAEMANQAKSVFLSKMSHELRTPLNAILGFSQLLEMQATDKTIKEHSQEIIYAGEHLLNLVSEILDLAKIESESIELSLDKCHLNKMIDNIITLINPLAVKHSIQIDNAINTPFYISVEETRFKQVLLNILSNAIKYNRENGKVIIDCTSNDKNMLCLSISDTGQGLTHEQLSHLFVSFERLGAEKSNIEGTGLGLKISKELMELMGGTITVESTVGKGSNFLIHVPLS